MTGANWYDMGYSVIRFSETVWFKGLKIYGVFTNLYRICFIYNGSFLEPLALNPGENTQTKYGFINRSSN